MNENHEKEEWGAWKIVSDMLDKPDENGIYPTSECYQKLYEFVCNQKQQLLNELEEGLPPLREEFPHNGNIGWERNCGFNSAIYSVKALIQSKKTELL